MTRVQRRAWSIVACMFVTTGVIWGLGYDIIGVFYHSFSAEFGWSHEKFSLLSTAFSLSFLIGGLLVGWILDRVAAQIVIAIGALTVMVGLLIASHAHSFEALIIAYLLIGLGNAAASILPASLIINNWFNEGRGLAMGVTLCGLPAGEMTMAWTASYIITAYGWRSAYLVLAAIAVALVVPLNLALVRTRPSAGRQTLAAASRALPGLDLPSALNSRAFWMIAAMFLFYGMAVSVALVHEVIYLEQDLGYSPAVAGEIWGLLLGSTLLTRAVMGYLADRIGNRRAVGLSFIVYAIGMIACIGSRNFTLFILFGVCFAFTMGAGAVILPVLLSEMLGLRCYGTLIGVMNACASVGLAAGPVIAGRIVDLTRSYAIAFEFAAALSIAAALATMACTPPVQRAFEQPVVVVPK
ncbi:MAG: MFS transporter [Candidatus Binataceae bacterium]